MVTRLERWLHGELERLLAPLFRLKAVKLGGAARGLAFQLQENLGSLSRKRGKTEIDALSRDERRDLRRAGVLIGRESVYIADLLKPQAVATRALIWSIFMGRVQPEQRLPIPAAGRVSVEPETSFPHAYYDAIGYRVIGKRALRIDMIERIADLAWDLNKKGAFPAVPELLALGGCDGVEMAFILKHLGYRKIEKEGIAHFRLRPRREPVAKPGKSKPKHPRGVQKKTTGRAIYDKDSPFAVLSQLKVAT